MNYTDERIIECAEFEEHLTDYLDGTLERAVHKAVAAHALRCPLCHALLNEVKDALTVCHEISAPKHSMTHLEARILSMTMPETAMSCTQFEEHLTDYLDGFLPATLFHRWERHAVLCDDCSDLPGAVVRSLAAIVSYKLDELPVPAGLHQRILQNTIGTERATAAKASTADRFKEWVRGFSFPISVPQLAPVSLMMAFAFLVVSQTVSADGSLTDVYAKSYQLAEQTYEQGAAAWNGVPQTDSPRSQEPINGTTFVEDKK